MFVEKRVLLLGIIHGDEAIVDALVPGVLTAATETGNLAELVRVLRRELIALPGVRRRETLTKLGRMMPSSSSVFQERMPMTRPDKPATTATEIAIVLNQFLDFAGLAWWSFLGAPFRAPLFFPFEPMQSSPSILFSEEDRTIITTIRSSISRRVRFMNTRLPLFMKSS